jgi:hypothetical protein
MTLDPAVKIDDDELTEYVFNSSTKILLVSSIVDYGIGDVYLAYDRALTSLKIAHDCYDWSNQRRLLSDEICARMIHSYLCQADRGYSHVMFFNGHELPSWTLRSIPKTIKKVLYSVDDPWSTEAWLYRKSLYDCVFTNELCTAERYDVSYLPLAHDSHQTIPTMKPELASDVCFIGTLYPERFDVLSRLIPRLVTETRMTFIGAGPLTPEIDPECEFIKRYWNIKTLSHSDYLAYMMSTVIALNLNRYSEPLTAHSLNARAYENSALGIFTLHDDTRPELKQLFGESVMTCRDIDEAYDKIVYYYQDHEARRGRINVIRKIVHDQTYENRVKKLLWCLQQPKA